MMGLESPPQASLFYTGINLNRERFWLAARTVLGPLPSLILSPGTKRSSRYEVSGAWRTR